MHCANKPNDRLVDIIVEDTACSRISQGGTVGILAAVVTKANHYVLDIDDLKCYIQVSLVGSPFPSSPSPNLQRSGLAYVVDDD